MAITTPTKPWYFPRSFSVTTSETGRELYPPLLLTDDHSKCDDTAAPQALNRTEDDKLYESLRDRASDTADEEYSEAAKEA